MLGVCGERCVCARSGAECHACDRSALTDIIQCSFFHARLRRPAVYRAERISRFVYIPLLPHNSNSNQKLKFAQLDFENTLDNSQEPFVTQTNVSLCISRDVEKQRNETQDGGLEKPAIRTMERERTKVVAVRKSWMGNAARCTRISFEEMNCSLLESNLL